MDWFGTLATGNWPPASRAAIDRISCQAVDDRLSTKVSPLSSMSAAARDILFGMLSSVVWLSVNNLASFRGR